MQEEIAIGKGITIPTVCLAHKRSIKFHSDRRHAHAAGDEHPLTDAEVQAWLGSLNDLRLALADLDRADARRLQLVGLDGEELDLLASTIGTTDGADAEAVLKVLAEPQAAPAIGKDFRFGVLGVKDAEFFGDAAYAALYAQAIGRLKAMGGTPVEIDYAPFLAAAELLYSGPWVAERTAAVGAFIEGAREAGGLSGERGQSQVFSNSCGLLHQHRVMHEV